LRRGEEVDMEFWAGDSKRGGCGRLLRNPPIRRRRKVLGMENSKKTTRTASRQENC